MRAKRAHFALFAIVDPGVAASTDYVRGTLASPARGGFMWLLSCEDAHAHFACDLMDGAVGCQGGVWRAQAGRGGICGWGARSWREGSERS